MIFKTIHTDVISMRYGLFCVEIDMWTEYIIIFIGVTVTALTKTDITIIIITFLGQITLIILFILDNTKLSI